MNEMTKEQQDLVNRIFRLVERAIEAYETDVMTRRLRLNAEYPVLVTPQNFAA